MKENVSGCFFSEHSVEQYSTDNISETPQFFFINDVCNLKQSQNNLAKCSIARM